MWWALEFYFRNCLKNKRRENKHDIKIVQERKFMVTKIRRKKKSKTVEYIKWFYWFKHEAKYKCCGTLQSNAQKNGSRKTFN